MWYLQKAHAGRYAAASAAGRDVPQMSLMIDPILTVLKDKDLISDSGSLINNHEPKVYITKLIQADGRNYTTAPEFVSRNEYFFDRPDELDLEDMDPKLGIPLEDWTKVIETLRGIPEDNWKAATLRQTLNSLIGKDGGENTVASVQSLSAADNGSSLIHGFLRWALSAGKHGPNGGDTMEILGKDEVILRMEVACGVLHELELGERGED
jgi:glutamyl-tRNA synthetase